jgi:DNA polymerase-1
MKLLVDADIVIFKHACVNEVEFQWTDEVSSKVADIGAAKDGIDFFHEMLLEDTGTTEAIYCFSSEPGFRYDVLPTYKYNRKGVERPDMLPELREHIEQNYKTKTKPRLEADDVMGVLSTIAPGKYVIATIDKDLKQIPGMHYRWATQWKDAEMFEVSEEEADLYFYRQVLMGDPTDGYKGCPGIGPKRSSKVLKDVTDGKYWEAIVEAYESKGFTEEDALVQARVARILRKDDWDFDNNCHKLWTP